jgi:hypothetical protein
MTLSRALVSPDSDTLNPFESAGVRADASSRDNHIAQLERLLSASLAAGDQHQQRERKWPVIYGLGLALATSAVLWAVVIAVAMRFL